MSLADDQQSSAKFTCIECDKVFNTLSGRNQHIRSIHSPDTHYCRDCGENKTFNHFRNLVKHVKDAHKRKAHDIERIEKIEKRILKKGINLHALNIDIYSITYSTSF